MLFTLFEKIKAEHDWSKYITVKDNKNTASVSDIQNYSINPGSSQLST